MNIRSTYSPGTPLNQFIDLIWIGDGTDLKMSSFHHAALFTELIFNYDGYFRVKGQNVENFGSTNGTQIISGLKSTPFHTSTSGTYNNVGILMKPHGYGMLIERFGTKEIEDLSEIIHENLMVTSAPNYAVVESYLTKLFGRGSIDPDIIKFEKQSSFELLGSGFHHLTPNKYLLLKQVNYASRLIQSNPNSSLTEIGLEAGFYDQSHFIRSFKTHYGYTPKQLKMGK